MGQAPDVTDLDYPEPPWHMHGFAVMRPVVVLASEIAVPSELEVVQRAGRATGLLAYVEYRVPSALAYRELAFLPCMVRPRGERRPLGHFVAAMYVDSEASVAGGRNLWGLPKRLAKFERQKNRVRITADDGLQLELAFRVFPASRPMRSKTATLQVKAGQIVRFRGEFESRVAPASVKIARFTGSGDGFRGFRGVGRFPRPALAWSEFSAKMLAPDFPGASQVTEAPLRGSMVY
ncbi:MAG TPA: acetoacetate decarboxylase family protein [Polyangiaceae bacterium]|nr:acetoacetate decarboxylase family protein [Polyangiaceae bacterium]